MTEPRIPPDPTEPAKGAWGGAWTVAYGCAFLLKGVGGAVWMDVLLRAARWGAAALRSRDVPDEVAETARRASDLLGGVPVAFGASQIPWLWGTAGLGAVAVVGGFGVLRRSGVARIASIGAVGASVLLSAGLTVHFAVSVLPYYLDWIREFAAVVADLERQSGRSAAPGLTAALRADRVQTLLWEVTLLAVHLGLAALLLVRLVGARTRGWCAGGPRGRLGGSGAEG